MKAVSVERHESMLGAWTSAAWSPSPGSELLGSVRRIWYFDGVLFARGERVFPDGSIEIVVQLDEPHSPAGAANGQRFAPVCITGLRLTSEVVVAPQGRCRVLGMVLSPRCAHLLLRDSLAPLTGVTTDLQAILGRHACELLERVDTNAGARTAIAAARAWLGERLRGTGEVRSNFRDAFGTTPKRYERILRFRAALDALAVGGTSLANIAADCGYYDQAHFTNEFREHAGMTPTAFLSASAFPGSTNLAHS